MLKPTSPGAWFIIEPGLAGRIDPSRESRLTTGVALCLENCSVTSKTNGTEFHIYYCHLGVPMFHEGGYTFYSSEEHFFSQKYFLCGDTLISTIIAVLNYHTHTCKDGCYLSIQPNMFRQWMITRYSNLALPPLQVWEKEEEERETCWNQWWDLAGIWVRKRQSRRQVKGGCEGKLGMLRMIRNKHLYHIIFKHWQSIIHTLCGYTLTTAFIHTFYIISNSVLSLEMFCYLVICKYS